MLVSGLWLLWHYRGAFRPVLTRAREAMARKQQPTETPMLLPTEAPPSTPEPAGTPSASPTPRFQLVLPLLGGAPPKATETPTLTPEPTETPTPKATKTPKPTPTPTIPWPEPLAAPPPSKIGLHVQWNNSPDIMEYMRRMKPRVVKSVGDFGFFEDLARESPQTIIVARIEDRISLEGDPIAAAQGFVARHLEQYQANPLVDYWEGLNEPDIGGKMDWYAAFEAERVRQMAAHGFKCAIGSFSTGVPEWEDIPAFLPAVRAARQHGGVLSLHEYDAPTMQRSVGAGLPGRPSYPDRGALTLRYRWWYEDYLKPQGLVIPLIITEAGVDGQVGNRPGPKGLGWRDFDGYWRDVGLGGDPLAFYLQELAWYDSELRKDSYVLGWTLFTVGPMNDHWRSFDVTPYLRQLATTVVVPTTR